MAWRSSFAGLAPRLVLLQSRHRFEGISGILIVAIGDDRGPIIGECGVNSASVDLQSADQKLTDAIEALPVGFALFDADDCYVLCPILDVASY